MRSLGWLALAVFLALAPRAAMGQEVDSLRRDLDQMRKQFETMKDSYEKAIETLQKRIDSLERRPAPAGAPSPAAPPATVTPPPAPAAPSAAQAPPGEAPARPFPTLAEIARPREPFALYERRGPGQFLFDIGVVGDFVGDFTSKAVESTDTCTFPGGCNRFFPRAIELGIFGQIDPYARGVVIFEAGEEVEDGSRSFGVELVEAYLQLLTLPFGTQLKVGKMLNRFGLLNEIHEHDFPQTDKPDVLTQFFGEEGLNETGVELTWVAPLPFYLELLAGIFNGQNEVAFGSDSFRFPLVTGRVRTFFDLGALGAIQVGASAAVGYTNDDLRSAIWGVDVKYKYTPEGWQWPLLTVAGEALFSRRNVIVPGMDAIIDPDTGEVIVPATSEGQQTQTRHGFYVYGQVQPWRRWLGGIRYDWTEYLSADGRQWAIEPYIAFMPSDFLRFRLAYKYTDRGDVRIALNPDGYPRSAHEVLVQATFFLGAHPTHGF
jgi:hypothetical protein